MKLFNKNKEETITTWGDINIDPVPVKTEVDTNRRKDFVEKYGDIIVSIFQTIGSIAITALIIIMCLNYKAPERGTVTYCISSFNRGWDVSPTLNEEIKKGNIDISDIMITEKHPEGTYILSGKHADKICIISEYMNEGQVIRVLGLKTEKFEGGD